MSNIHLARQVDFKFLVSKLQENIDNRSIYEVSQGDLSIFCYTNACVYNQMWNPWNVIARGLIIERVHQQVIATPFPKFFNYNEQNILLPESSFETYEKLDGSLGICYYYQDQWHLATKSHFNSPQAQWAQNYLSRLNLKYLIPGTTYLFEIIYAANKIVVKYPFETLVLLSAYNQQGEELNRKQIENLAQTLEVRIANLFNFSTLQEVVGQANQLDDSQEGFVIKFSCGLRLKIKGKEYFQLHKMLAGITPNNILNLMKQSGNLESFRRQLPEEHWAEFDRIYNGFEIQIQGLVKQVEQYHKLYQEYTPKELGLILPTLPEVPRNFIFARRKLGLHWYKDPKIRQNLSKILAKNILK